MKKILIALALTGLAATSAQAGGYHGGYHGYHGGYHSGSNFWWGAAFGAALSIPFYYAYSSRSYADPYPYSYYNPGPVYYNSAPVVYVQNPPVYVQSQPAYTVAAAQPRTVVTQSPTNNGVIELGPANSQPQANSSQVQPQGSSAAQGSGDQWFVYPGKGQNQQQVANDRFECNRWATSESGYDPELRTHRNPEMGPVAYGRALSACLEGRGYTVR